MRNIRRVRQIQTTCHLSRHYDSPDSLSINSTFLDGQTTRDHEDCESKHESSFESRLDEQLVSSRRQSPSPIQVLKFAQVYLTTNIIQDSRYSLRHSRYSFLLLTWNITPDVSNSVTRTNNIFIKTKQYFYLHATVPERNVQIFKVAQDSKQVLGMSVMTNLFLHNFPSSYVSLFLQYSREIRQLLWTCHPRIEQMTK